MLGYVCVVYFLAVASAQLRVGPNNEWQNSPTPINYQPGATNRQDWRTNSVNNVNNVNHVNCGPEHLRSGVEEVPKEYLQAHHRFTSDLLKHPGYWNNIQEHGVSFTNTFTLGHFLAVLGQKQFQIPSDKINKLLRLPTDDKVVDSYAKQFFAYEDEDNHVYPSSYLFTPYDNIKSTPAIERLFTRKWVLTLYNNQFASHNINEYVRVATRDYIDDELVPEVPPFHEQTAGVYVNTFHYANDWKHEWTKLGKHQFNTPTGPVQVETYETHGAFPVLETQHYTAVAVPLEGDIKHTVFVQPKVDLKDYFSNGHVDEIFTNGPHHWPLKNVRVQVPHINLTVAHGFSQLNEEGIQCVKGQGAKSHELQPIVQVVHFSLNHDEVVYSVANGAQVNLADATRGNTYRHLNQPNKQQSTFNPTPLRNNLNRANTQYSQNQNSYTTAELVHDKPYFVYFHDKSIGPFAFNAISSNFVHEDNNYVRLPFNQRQARHHDSPIDFEEQTKVHRWNCEN
jgi:hypothetical protein